MTRPSFREASRRSGLAMVLLLLIMTGRGSRAEPPPDPKPRVGRFVLEVRDQGHVWSSQVHVPRGYDGRRAIPLVLVLHGSGSSGAGYLKDAGWAVEAERGGFIAVAPDGLPLDPERPADFLFNPRVWNSGQFAEDRSRSQIDDTRALDAILARVARYWRIDARRIYVAGHSNGAAMAFRLAAERPQRYAAIAAVSGICYRKVDRLARPVPTLFMTGMEDPILPLDGGLSILPWGTRRTPPIALALARWSQANGGPIEPTAVRPGESLLVWSYETGAGSDGLRAVFLPDHGHAWPGGSGLQPARLLGPNSNEVRATPMIWDYFSGHARTRARD